MCFFCEDVFYAGFGVYFLYFVTMIITGFMYKVSLHLSDLNNIQLWVPRDSNHYSASINNNLTQYFKHLLLNIF